jgi:hypothetical protein
VIQNCHQFERRIQDLLDSRIDPETDDLLCAHSAICESCHQSLMAYSLLHTEFLRDTDSMKIKLENLGLHEFAVRRRNNPDLRKLFAIAASIAAMVLVIATLSLNRFSSSGIDRPIAGNFKSEPISHHGQPDPVDFEKLVHIGSSLNHYDLYNYSTELPPLNSFMALSVCFDWLQRSWFNAKKDESDPGVGGVIHLDYERRFVDGEFLAFNA